LHAFLASPNNIYSHQKRSAGFNHTTNAFAAEPWPQTHNFWCIESSGNVSGGCQCVLFLFKQNMQIEADALECK